MAGARTPTQQRRIDDLLDFQRTIDHVKRLVAELESNRAAKPVVIANICATIERELSQARQRSLTANVGTFGDQAGALSVLAGRAGGGVNLKIRGLTEGLGGLQLQLDALLKQAMAPDPRSDPPGGGASGHS